MKHVRLISVETARPARAESLLTKQQEIGAATDIIGAVDAAVDVIIKVVEQFKGGGA